MMVLSPIGADCACADLRAWMGCTKLIGTPPRMSESPANAIFTQ
jgi:hypothetical protein